MSDVWFTADTHFGHRNLIEHGMRPGFDTIQEHDEFLITRWNETVRPQDQVWHLGDWGLGPKERYLEIVGELNGEIHLIPGNHDPVHPSFRDSHKHLKSWYAAGFASIQAYARRSVAGRRVLLSHLPYVGDHTGTDRASQYRLPNEGLVLLHGHVHDAWLIRDRMVNVGVDVHDFRPLHLDAFADLIKAWHA